MITAHIPQHLLISVRNASLETFYKLKKDRHWRLDSAWFYPEKKQYFFKFMEEEKVGEVDDGLPIFKDKEPESSIVFFLPYSSGDMKNRPATENLVRDEWTKYLIGPK